LLPSTICKCYAVHADPVQAAGALDFGKIKIYLIKARRGVGSRLSRLRAKEAERAAPWFERQRIHPSGKVGSTESVARVASLLRLLLSSFFNMNNFRRGKYMRELMLWSLLRMLRLFMRINVSREKPSACFSRR